MNGWIIHVDHATAAGLLRGKDGHRYSFDRTDWLSDQSPAVGDEVDFEPVSGAATEVYMIKRASLIDVEREKEVAFESTNKLSINVEQIVTAPPIMSVLNDWELLITVLTLLLCFLPYGFNNEKTNIFYGKTESIYEYLFLDYCPYGDACNIGEFEAINAMMIILIPLFAIVSLIACFRRNRLKDRKTSPAGTILAYTNICVPLYPYIIFARAERPFTQASGGSLLIVFLGIIMILVSLNIIKKRPFEFFVSDTLDPNKVSSTLRVAPASKLDTLKPSEAVTRPPAEPAQSSIKTRLEHLEHLAKLRYTGALTDAAFEAEKKKILDE